MTSCVLFVILTLAALVITYGIIIPGLLREIKFYSELWVDAEDRCHDYVLKEIKQTKETT